MQTLRYTMATLEYVKGKGVEVRFHGRGKNEASHYCGQCEVSIKKKPLVNVPDELKHALVATELIQLFRFCLFVSFIARSVQHFVHS